MSDQQTMGRDYCSVTVGMPMCIPNCTCPEKRIETAEQTMEAYYRAYLVETNASAHLFARAREHDAALAAANARIAELEQIGEAYRKASEHWHEVALETDVQQVSVAVWWKPWTWFDTRTEVQE